MQLVESTIVGPVLGIASTFTFCSLMFKELNLKNICALSMELCIQLAKLPVLPWDFWKMTESGTSPSKRHAKFKLALSQMPLCSHPGLQLTSTPQSTMG